jgi:hypothetical protein
MCRVQVLAAMSVLALLAGCGKSAATKYDSPEAVFKAFQSATEEGDGVAVANCLTADDQAMMADGLIIGASFSTMGDSNKQKDLTALLKRHDIDLDAEGPLMDPAAGKMSASDKIKDKPALIGDLMTWLKENADDDGGFNVQVKKLDQLKVDGDRATGVVETDRGNRPVEFHRVDGGWLLSLEGDRPRGGPSLDAGPGPSGFQRPSDKVSDSSPAADPTAGHGTLTIKDQTHALKHAVAYRTKRFDDPCTAVLLTTKPISDSKLTELQGILEREGSDFGFFLFDVSLKLMFDEAGKPVFLYAWADNVNINDNSGVEAQVTESGGRIVGTAKRNADEKDDDDFKYQFDVTFDVALLPTKGQAAEPSQSRETEKAVESPTEIDRVESPKEVEPVKEAEKATDAANEPKDTAEETPREPAVAVDETPREPATVEQAIKLLDLSKFPLMPGVSIPREHRRVGQLMYQRTADLAESFEFQRKHLKELGWKELPGAQSIESGNPRAIFTQDGFIVSMSAALFVSIQNHGNVNLGKLPVPSGAESRYGDASMASYVTTAAAEETRKFCEESLLNLGWKPYGYAGDTKYFKQNAVKLSARVSTHQAQPGKTFIDYDTELLSADLPVPADVDDPRYDDAMKWLSFDHSGNAVEKLSAFYTEELAKQGFQPTSKPIGDKEVAVLYRNDAKDMITLDMKLYNDLTRVGVRHYSAEEVAELDRRHQEEVAKREAERKLQVEAEKREDDRRVAAEAARREAEAAKQLAMKVTVPIPGKAKKVEQGDEDSVEITVALGAGKPILEALRKHFEAAGWSADKVELEDDDGLLRLSKGEQTLEFDYTEWITAGEIDVDGRNVVLELGRDIAEFASLGGLPAPKPPAVELIAKAPADIPIPADARDLKVRTGSNVAYEVAADIKQAAAYFRAAMARHGWTYDASFSRVDDKMASLSFKKGRAPCGISLTNIFGGDLTSVTIAGGGMDWKKLKGARATADQGVLAFASAPPGKTASPNVKQYPPATKKTSAPQPTKSQPKTAAKRSS